MVQAGAYICRSECSLDRYLELYREHRSEILEEYRDGVQKLDDYKWTVYTTWTISFKRLSAQSAMFLRLCAYLHHDGISEAIFRNAASNTTTHGPSASKPPKAKFKFLSKRIANVSRLPSDTQGSGLRAKEFLAGFRTFDSAWDSQKFLKMITEIRSYSLIEFDIRNQTYSIHPLVHAWIHTTISSDEAFRTWTQWILGMSITRRHHSEDYAFRRTLQPHINTVLEGGNSSGLEFYEDFGHVYYEVGQWREAEKLFVQVEEITLRVHGAEHPDTLSAMGNLASTYRHQGRWKEAEQLELQVKDGRLKVLGEEHPDTLLAMGNLASTYRYQGRWKEAEELELQVKDGCLKVLGAEHPDTLLAMGNLAITYSNQGRLMEAEELDLEVKDGRLKVLGAEHPGTLSAMGNLAVAYKDQGRWNEAEELELQVKDGCLRMRGEEHPDTLSAMGNLANTYTRQGRWKEAEELGLQVKDGLFRVLGEEHPHTLSAMGNLAAAYEI